MAPFAVFDEVGKTGMNPVTEIEILFEKEWEANRLEYVAIVPSIDI